MGSDPRRLDGLRQDERFAALLLERVTGGTVRAHDVGTRQGAYDLDLTFPGGRTAAVEVTTHTGIERRDPALLVRPRRATTSHPARSRPRAIGDDGPTSAPTASGPVATMRELPAAVTDLLTVPHVARRAAKVAAARGVDERHLFIGIGEGGLPDAVRLALAGRPADLAAGPGLPTDDPEVPDGVSHLWLTTGGDAAPLVCWSRAEGWTAHAT